MKKQNKQDKNKESKEGKEEGKRIKVCPKCGSTNITWDYKNAWVVGYGMNRDSCNDCNLKGNFPTIEENKLDDFRRMLQEK